MSFTTHSCIVIRIMFWVKENKIASGIRENIQELCYLPTIFHLTMNLFNTFIGIVGNVYFIHLATWD